MTQRAVMIILFWFCVLAAGMPARAHDGDTTIFTAVTVDGAMVRVRLTLSSLPDRPFFQSMKGATSKTPGTYQPLAEAIASHVRVQDGTFSCHAARKHIEPPTPISASLSATVDFVCPGPVRDLDLTNDLFDVLGSELHMIARLDWGSDSHTFTFGSDVRRLTRSNTSVREPVPADLDIRFILIAVIITAALGIAALGLGFRRRR